MTKIAMQKDYIKKYQMEHNFGYKASESVTGWISMISREHMKIRRRFQYILFTDPPNLSLPHPEKDKKTQMILNKYLIATVP